MLITSPDNSCSQDASCFPSAVPRDCFALTGGQHEIYKYIFNRFLFGGLKKTLGRLLAKYFFFLAKFPGNAHRERPLLIGGLLVNSNSW